MENNIEKNNDICNETAHYNTETFDFENSEDIVAKTALENFGIKYMFPWQRLVVSNILEAYECDKYVQKLTPEQKEEFDAENDDSFCKGRQIVLLPTGAGKSLCFQVPALLLDGPTMVIYPLVALMSDQQRRMEEGNLSCVVFRGGQSEVEREENFKKISEGAKIILANPEVLKNLSLVRRLSGIGIKHIAIDEAHCVSEWGDSFRPAYLELGKVIKEISPPVVTAFTATASPSVLERVSEVLFGGCAHIVRSESDRKNIHYFVNYSAAKKKEVLRLALTEQRPMIVFCGTRHKCEDMCREINVCFGPGTSKFYHAGLEKNEKDCVEKWFFNSKNGILCATCAYGMGVDKKDIKTVVHLEPSPTAEAYIQEAGRGGRDGSIAKAILIWSPEDSLKYASNKKNSREVAMRDFAETKDCRRQVLLNALGAEQTVCSGCDLCNARKEIEENKEKSNSYKMKKETAVLSDWQESYAIVRKNKNFLTEMELELKIFRHMNRRDIELFGKNIWSHSDVCEVVRQLEKSGKIKKAVFLWKNRLYTSDNAFQFK